MNRERSRTIQPLQTIPTDRQLSQLSIKSKMPVYRPESPTQFYANYNSIPAKKTQKKINFFFNPYTLKTELQKSMAFESDED